MDSFFSQSQLSVAFAIVQAAPSGVSMEDFTIGLHKAIRPTPRDDQDENHPKRYIDSCEYWKGQYNSSLEENRELRRKASVEQERRRIFERAVSDGNGDDGIVSRKRPLGMEEVEDWIENEEGSDLVDLPADEYLLLSSYTIRIARHRRDLESITKGSDTPDHLDNLLTAACAFMDLLKEALSECLTPLFQLKCDNESQSVLLLQQVMLQITLGYLAAFQALNELTTTIPGRKKRSALSIRLVKFFVTALDHLHLASTFQAKSENDHRGKLRNKRARIEAGEYVVNKYLSRTLVQICQMDWKSGMVDHGEILEGILCSILKHTGHLLSRVIFKEHVADSDKPGNISMERPPSPAVATKFEFRYTIPILHAALGGNLRKEQVVKVLAENQQGTGRALNGHMLFQAKKRMQEQLVKSAVGSDAEGLRFPAPPEDSDVYPDSDKGDERVWFLEAVWTLVGWELAVERSDG